MKYFTTSRNSYGFTIIETLIVIALSASMMGALSLLIYSFNSSYSYGQLSSISAMSIRSVMNEVELLTLSASNVLQSHTFQSTTYTSSSNVLVLEIPSIDSYGNIISNTYDYAVFYVDGTYAYRILEANTTSKRITGTKQLSDTISSLVFSYNNSDFTLVDTVTVDVQTTVHYKEQTSVDNRHEQMYLRNF